MRKEAYPQNEMLKGTLDMKREVRSEFVQVFSPQAL
jgi:hypothetical protein